jgi:hypothetical protein
MAHGRADDEIGFSLAQIVGPLRNSASRQPDGTAKSRAAAEYRDCLLLGH